ncbi:hypothetical protein GCM10009609_32070 [Pseudonocardia aurantiaca]|uniref:Uncharacterized protein n=1 Tax=Pseudonocardia aurantiaca TaxID=75290 RepID=A0ABW4FQH2_9PSEU
MRDPDSRWYDDEDYLRDLLAEALQPLGPCEEHVQVSNRGACRDTDTAADSEDHGPTSQTH